MKIQRPLLLRHACTSGALLLPVSWLSAATWDGGAGTGKWQDPTNWSTDSVPAGAEVALVNANAVVAYDSSTGFSTTGQLQIGAVASVNATVNLASGAGTLVFGGDAFANAARIGASGGNGALSISAGKVQVGTGVAGNDASLNLAAWNSGGASNGTISVSGGELQVGRRILMGANNAAHVASITLSGAGLLNLVATGSAGEGDLGMIRLGNGTNTLNFDGGEFRGRGIRQDGGTAGSAIYYNGTRFTLNGNSGTGVSALIGSGGSAVNEIKNGGLIIDTSGFTGTIARGLGSFSGHTGILTKEGAGTLVFAAGGSSYASTVVNGGTVNYTANDVYGTHTGSTHALTVNAGALVTNSTGTAGYVTFQNLALNGGELRSTNTLSAVGGVFQAYGIKGTVTVGGTTASTISDAGQASGHINIGSTSGGNAVFNVADVTGTAAADLTVSAKLQNQGNASASGYVSTGMAKTGSGTMSLSGVNRYTGSTDVQQGTLAITGSGSIATSTTINIASGAILDVSGTTSPWELATGQTLVGTGTVIGSARIAGNLSVGQSPGIMTFGGDLTLLDTSVTTLELTGAAFGLGSFDLVLGGAGTQSVAFDGILNLFFDPSETYTNGSSVKIFDFEGYSGNFDTIHINGIGSGQSAYFDASTGSVTIIPEPGCALLGGAGLLLLLRRRRQLA